MTDIPSLPESPGLDPLHNADRYHKCENPTIFVEEEN